MALFDQSSFAKFLVLGRDAEQALSWLCANDVARPPGSLTYTQMLNQKGKLKRRGRTQGRRSDVKKAFVSLVPGQEINFQSEAR